MGYQADRILDGSDPVLRPEQTQAYLLTGSFKPYCREYRVLPSFRSIPVERGGTETFQLTFSSRSW